MKNSNRQTNALIIICAFLVVLLGFSVVQFIQHHGKVGVKVVLLPPDSTLTIDGKRAKGGTVYFTKTTHTLVATRQYFTDVTKTINFATYNKLQPLYMDPLPESAQAQQYLLDNPKIQEQRESAGSAQAAQVQQQLSKNKLTPLLPYTGPGTEYAISYTADTQANGSLKVTIYIKADTNQAKLDALDWIKQQDVDPNTLTIIYQSLDGQTSPSTGSPGGGSEYQ